MSWRSTMKPDSSLLLSSQFRSTWSGPVVAAARRSVGAPGGVFGNVVAVAGSDGALSAGLVVGRHLVVVRRLEGQVGVSVRLGVALAAAVKCCSVGDVG